MARVAIAAAGAAIGFLLGGPSGISLGWSIGSLIGTLLFPQKIKGPRLEDLTVQVSAYGVPIPKVWGWYRASGNVIWATDLVEIKNEEKLKGGPTSITYDYYGNFSVVICEGIAEPYRIWADSKLIWGRKPSVDASEDAKFGFEGGHSQSNTVVSKYAENISFVRGTEDEIPPPLHERYDGVGNVPAYRGYMRIDFDMLPLRHFGNRVPNISVEVFAGTPSDIDAESVNPTSDADGPKAIIIQQPDIKDERYASADFSSGTVTLNRVPDGALLWSVTVGHNVSSIHITADDVIVVADPDSGFFTFLDPLDGSVLASFTLTTTSADPWGKISSINTGGSTYVMVRAWHRTVLFSGSGGSWDVLWETSGGTDEMTLTLGPKYAYAIEATPNQVKRIEWNAAMIVGVVVTPEVASISGGAIAVHYDKITNTVVVLTETHLYKFNSDLTEILLTKSLGFSQVLSPSHLLSNRLKSFPGEIGVRQLVTTPTSHHIFHFYNFTDFTQIETVNSDDTTWEGHNLGLVVEYGFSSSHRVALVDANVSPDTHRYWLMPRVELDDPLLRDIVRDVCVRCQMTEGTDFDVSGLGNTVVLGYGVTRQMSGRDAIEPLQSAYYFDGIETDGKLVFQYRQQTPVMTIDEFDLGTAPFGAGRVDKVIDTRQQELELPYRVVVRFPDPYRDYQPNTQAQMRHRNVAKSDQEASIDIPVVMLPDFAKQTATKNLYLAWQMRTTYTLALPRKYIELDPGDTIIVPRLNAEFTIYITNIDMGADGLMKIVGKSHDEVVYNDTSDGGNPSPVPVPEIEDASPMVYEFLDGPLVREEFDSYSGFLLATEGQDQTVAFPGGIFYKSADGETYAHSAWVDEEVTMGTTLGVLPSHGHTTTDYDNVLRVVINRGTLSSVGYRQMMNGQNLCMIGNEYCAFAYATEVYPGVYDLSVLRRGIQGTHWARGTHVTGERFVLMKVAYLTPVIIASAEIGLLRYYKGVTYGLSLDGTDRTEFTAQNLHLKPIAPAQLTATINMGGDYEIVWVRCARKYHEWIDGPTPPDTPLDEPYEQYTLKIFDGVNVVRTAILTVPSFTYTSAMQTTDFGSPQSEVKCAVCQNSSRVGEGYYITRWLGDSVIDLGG